MQGGEDMRERTSPDERRLFVNAARSGIPHL
jgi:hypothetical protein